MKLKDWRKKKKLSQQQLAEKLEDFARAQHPDRSSDIKLRQTTLGYWERGTVPRKFWLSIVSEFTKKQVSADDFVEATSGAQ